MREKAKQQKQQQQQQQHQQQQSIQPPSPPEQQQAQPAADAVGLDEGEEGGTAFVPDEDAPAPAFREGGHHHPPPLPPINDAEEGQIQEGTQQPIEGGQPEGEQQQQADSFVMDDGGIGSEAAAVGEADASPSQPPSPPPPSA